MKARYKLAIVAPTCFYYQVELFRQLTAHPRIDLMVYFCSDEAVRAQDVRDMYHTDEKWGDESELLVGYPHKFLPNYSPRPSYLKWPYGLMNFSIWKEIKETKPDIVVLMSWMNITWWVAILACLWYRVPFLYMTDANAQAEQIAPRWKKWLKKLLLGAVLFKAATGFLCAGTANRQLYQFYGVPEEKLVPFAYSWGYETQIQAWEDLKSQRKQLRAQQGIADDSLVILYCGRLGKEKGISDLIAAFQRVNCQHKTLNVVGDGQLRKSLEKYTSENGLDSVHFYGFRNRYEIAEFYATADLLVLPSKRETWGIVVNEALCFALPVIVSDQVGAANDLVGEGENGFTFPAGDVQALAARIQQIIELPEEERHLMGIRSREQIKRWVRRGLAQSIDQYFDLMYSQQPPEKR